MSDQRPDLAGGSAFQMTFSADLQLRKYGGRCNEERAETDNRRNDAGLLVTGTSKHCLNCLGALGSYKTDQLIEKGALGCFAAKRQAGHGEN
jgi:hypothetical protein